MKFLRYDTGICPRCGSSSTALLKAGHDGKFSFGLIYPVCYTGDPAGQTIACIACDVRWNGIGKYRWMDQDELDSLKKEWEKDVKAAREISESEILSSLAEEIGYTNTKSKKTISSPLIGAAAKAIESSLGEPVHAVKEMIETYHDFTGSGLHNYYTEDELSELEDK